MCLNAMSLGQPSIVEISVGTVVCGTQYTAPGIGRVEAERLVQPNSQEARFGTGSPCIHGSERITNAFLKRNTVLSTEQRASLRGCVC